MKRRHLSPAAAVGPTVNADGLRALSPSGGKRLSPARQAAAIVPLFSFSQLQRCNVWPISIKSRKLFQALNSAEHLGGNDGGQLAFVSIACHSAVRFPPPPPGPPRTSVDFRGSPRKKLEQIPICVNSIPRFRNRISVFQRPSTARNRDGVVGANVPLLGDRPQRSILVRGQPRNLGGTLGASRPCPETAERFGGKSTPPKPVAPNMFRT